MSDTMSIRRTIHPLPAPNLGALIGRFSAVGIIEHALGAEPNPPSGHCVRDAGHALGLAALLPDDPRAEEVALRCLRQLTMSRARDHGLHLRLDENGQPTGQPQSDEATASAIWGLAQAAARLPSTGLGALARRELERLRGFTSTDPRAVALAVLGAVDLLHNEPASPAARQLLAANAPSLLRPAHDPSWPWPEARLTHANALLCEALLSAGAIRHDRSMVDDGLELLGWLVHTEQSPLGHFSFTPTAGRGPGESGGFDQRPIEAWTMARTCARAAEIDRDRGWRDAAVDAAEWFAGRNDVGCTMWDPRTGAAFDGLRFDGPTSDEGTESTISLVGALVAADAACEPRHRHRRH